MDTSAAIELPSPAPESPGFLAPIGLAVMVFAVYLIVSLQTTIWDRDEARFARATVEMVRSGNYLVPTFTGKLRPDKPILSYWLMSVPVRLFGSSEWALRVVSVLSVALACFFTYLIGRTLISHRAGLWAMVLLPTTGLMLMDGAVATSDALLLAFITGSFAVFARALKNGLGLVHLILLTLLFAGGLLTKGPVALIPIVPFIVMQLALNKAAARGIPGSILLLLTVAAAGGIFAAWFVPANNATHGEFYEQAFKHHVLERIKQPLENHGGHSLGNLLGFYPLVILLGFFPWTLFLPGALVQLSRGDSGGKIGRLFLTLWIVTFLLTMILVSTKLPHYILPLWPALSLCVGAFLAKASVEEPKSYGGFWTFLGWLMFAVVLVALAAGLGYGPEYAAQRAVEKAVQEDGSWSNFAQDSRTARSVIVLLLLIVTVPLLFRPGAASFKNNARVLAIAALVFLPLCAVLLAPSIESIKLSKRAVDVIFKETAHDATVTLAGFDEASLIFYLDERPSENIVPENSATKPNPAASRVDVRDQKVADWFNARGRAVLVIPAKALEQVKANKAITLPANMHPVGSITGFNYSKGHWVELLIFRRDE
ncbi:MAG TPA: glycosyltransferase family 39 protein [Planctomycetota bacterium]|nr:glycosyltransferase family 39 protein [Planctomycetota bacterium]